MYEWNESLNRLIVRCAVKPSSGEIAGHLGVSGALVRRWRVTAPLAKPLYAKPEMRPELLIFLISIGAFDVKDPHRSLEEELIHWVLDDLDLWRVQAALKARIEFATTLKKLQKPSLIKEALKEFLERS